MRPWQYAPSQQAAGSWTAWQLVAVSLAAGSGELHLAAGSRHLPGSWQSSPANSSRQLPFTSWVLGAVASHIADEGKEEGWISLLDGGGAARAQQPF